jgi:F-type H+-transporting ATPase subunit a
MSSSAEVTSQEYIKHHLTNLSAGEGFWTFHLDTLGWSIFLGIVFLTIFRSVAKKS